MVTSVLSTRPTSQHSPTIGARAPRRTRTSSTTSTPTRPSTPSSGNSPSTATRLPATSAPDSSQTRIRSLGYVDTARGARALPASRHRRGTAPADVPRPLRPREEGLRPPRRRGIAHRGDEALRACRDDRLSQVRDVGEGTSAQRRRHCDESGLSHRISSNRAKSVFVEHTVRPCSIARAARWASREVPSEVTRRRGDRRFPRARRSGWESMRSVMRASRARNPTPAEHRGDGSTPLDSLRFEETRSVKATGARPDADRSAHL